MSPANKLRLDELLVARGLAETRSRAKALILAGKVRLGTERLDKPGRALPEDAPVEREAAPRFVGRGGGKLEGFLESFAIEVAGLHVLDVGASTGGFTDCCLQRGAAAVTCVDVGRAQLHGKLLADPRVTNLEKVNARHLQPGDLPEPAYPVVVMDLAFISLCKVLPAVWPFLERGGILVALVKPQFEAPKAEVDRGRGVLRDPAVQEAALASVRDFALAELPGAELVGTMDSPVRGTDGNREFLLGLRKAKSAL
jgi:23S rRNA (cytidine1920-2'-O)/16S rRNA (cytidine1409-2'-O)-methyltransferase